MTILLGEISALIDESIADVRRIERTLTDGYAYALSLEAERWRLQKRIEEVAQGLQRGDTAQKAKELSTLSKRLDGNANDLSKLRGVLAELRRHADSVR